MDFTDQVVYFRRLRERLLPLVLSRPLPLLRLWRGEDCLGHVLALIDDCCYWFAPVGADWLFVLDRDVLGAQRVKGKSGRGQMKFALHLFDVVDVRFLFGLRLLTRLLGAEVSEISSG